MKDFILLSHGNLARELKLSLEMILGKHDNLHYICLDEEGIEKFDNKLKKIIHDLEGQGKDIYFLCDIKGGTPFNLAFKYILETDSKLKIVTGMNLPLVMDLIMNVDDLDLTSSLDNARQAIDIIGK